MPTSLATLRSNAPASTAAQFLQTQPGCFIQYYDDTPAKDPTKALSARRFDPIVAGEKQRDGCAVAFSLQPFWERRTEDCLLCVRSLGVDVDLVPSAERPTLSADDIDRRKDAYLQEVLLRFSLTPQWVTETRHGFHLIFRVQPQREPKDVQEAHQLNRRLVRALCGDVNAVLLTQVFRVPGTWQFKQPGQPFLCRLLVDHAATILPYPLTAVRTALDEWGAPPTANATVAPSPGPTPGTPRPRWHTALAGVPEGERNATAARLVGAILWRLPEELWETAGWGGLTAWNGRNSTPLPERELRAVYESIARRERGRRRTGSARARTATSPQSPRPHA